MPPAAAAEQHAEQAGAEEAGREAAEHAHAGLVEETALCCCCRCRGGRRGCARLRHGAVHRLRGAGRRRRRGRRGIGFSAARTHAAAAARTGVSRRDCDHQGYCQRKNNGHRLGNAACALGESHGCFLFSPPWGKPPLTWADLPKSEAIIGNYRCGPRSRGCDDFPHDPVTLRGVLGVGFGGWAPAPRMGRAGSPPTVVVPRLDRGIQGGFNRSSQHFSKGGCDEWIQTRFGPDCATTRAASEGTAGELQTVLDGDCLGALERRCCS